MELKTGLSVVDRITGGLLIGRTTMILSDAGGGKTALCAGLALRFQEQGQQVEAVTTDADGFKRWWVRYENGARVTQVENNSWDPWQVSPGTKVLIVDDALAVMRLVNEQSSYQRWHSDTMLQQFDQLSRERGIHVLLSVQSMKDELVEKALEIDETANEIMVALQTFYVSAKMKAWRTAAGSFSTDRPCILVSPAQRWM